VGTAIGGSSDKWMSDGLVGHWKMDEASWNGTAGEVIDSSGNGNNGTSTSATISAGKFGNGGSFDGVDDYVDMGSDTSLNFENNGVFSINFWIKPSSFSTTWRVPLLIRELYLNSGYRCGITSTGNLRFWTNQSGGTLEIESDTSMSLNQWNHISITYNDTQAFIYLNSKQVASGAGSYISGTSSLQIGTGWSNEFFNGQIDDVRIYNRALSPDEVKKLYEYAPGPVGHWKMDEKSGTTAYDISGNGNHGTLTNGPTWTEGKYGGAVEFDGVDDYVNTNLSVNSNQMTIETWIKPNSILGEDTGIMGTNSSGFAIGQRQDGILFVWQAWGNHWSWYGFLEADKWTHIAVTVNDLTIKTYVDGKHIGSATSELEFSETSSIFKIGTNPWANYFDGSIDDVRIYNYARTQKQILEDMNAGRPAQNKPVAYWKFNEGYGTTVYDSAGNNNGTINGASWTNDGKFGKGLSFDGVDDYVGISNNISINPDSAITVSTWIKPTSLSSEVHLVRKGSPDQYGLRIDAGKLEVHIDGNNSCGGSYSLLTGNNNLEINEWQYVAFTFSEESDQVVTYINGDRDNSVIYTGCLPSSSSQLSVGKNIFGGAEGVFNGKIDEVKIYNYALSEDEIKKDYNQGKALVMGSPQTASGATGQSAEYCVPGDTATCDPPVAEWKFDDKSGTTVYDTSSNANHGTMSNMEDSDWKTSDQCKKGRCLEFDGVDDYLDAGSSPSLILANGGSIEAWVKIGKLETGWDNGIIHKGDGASWVNNHYGIIEMDGTNKFILTISDGTNYLGLSGPTTKDLEENVWYHVAGTWNNSSKCIYVNGVLQECVNSTIMPKDTMTGCSVSTGRYNGSYYFNGSIDDVKIYNYARTPAQIAWDYNRGKPVGHWKMDEGEGMTVYDHSGNGNHGTMVNMSQSAWVDGKVNGGLEFDGVDDYINMGNVSSIKNNTTGAISLWVNPQKTGLTFPVGWWGSISDYMRLEIRGNSSVTWLTEVGNVGNSMTSNSGVTSPIGQWTHIVINQDGTNAKMYVNGELQTATANNTWFGTHPTLSFYIASSLSWDNIYRYEGKIDDVRIYNYALTAEQVKEVYNGGAVRFR
jgi:hypothetical protein